MLDADMERFLKLDKDAFIGKDATLAQQNASRSLQLIYFEVDSDNSDVRGNEPIYANGSCIGITTSGGYGHFTGRNLGFGYVPPAFSSTGTELEILMLGEPRKARILADAVHDPSNERPRA